MKKEELYNRIKQWVTTNLKTADNNIYFDDTEKKSIATSAAFLIADNGAALGQFVDFKINFGMKDGRMRIQASGFTYHGDGGAGGRIRFDKPFNTLPYIKKINRKICEDFDKKFSAMIASIEKAAQTSADAGW